MLVMVKVQNKTYKLGEMWGFRTAMKVVRWDDENNATWPYRVVTGMRSLRSLSQWWWLN